VLDETSPPGKGFLAEVVKDWEAQTAPLEKSGARIVHLRTGVVFSRRGGAIAKLLPIFAKGLGGKLGTGTNWMSWIHITDIVRAVLFCLDNEKVFGIVNGTAPEPARNDRFTVAFARALKRSVFLPVPGSALKTTLGEAASLVLGSQRVLPRRLTELGFEFEYRELVPALEELAEPMRGGQHEFVAEQWLPLSPEKVFPYFCSEKNLEELTPPFLNFRVIGKSTSDMRLGTLIDYRLSLHGIPMKWRTEIEKWVPGKSFVDNQLSGPYAKWHHTHDFVPLAGGTLVKDRVLYKLPLGFFGETFAGWKVARDVATIFSYRRKKIIELFGSRT
jgi:ligand-binding SRPBCC domain-containing protein